MPHFAPPTLTAAEQKAILRATAANLRDAAIYSVALDTGLRLGDLGSLDPSRLDPDPPKRRRFARNGYDLRQAQLLRGSPLICRTVVVCVRFAVAIEVVVSRL